MKHRISRTHSLVLRKVKGSAPFVVYHQNKNGDVYWGHAFKDTESALIDFKTRIKQHKESDCCYPAKGMI